MIPFGDYLPDLPDLRNPGATIANNVLPAIKSYRPWPQNVVFSNNALTARCRGAFFAKSSDGVIHIYAGDATTLYEISDGDWGNVSQGGGADAYTLADEETWEFTKFKEEIVAVSGVNADTAIPGTNDIQTITMGGANFADLGGSPPQARHVATVRDFIVVGNTWDGSDGLVANRIRWSGKGNEATWAVSASTQADFEDSLNGGWCQRIMGGEYGVIFMENAIYRMTYIGSPIVWQFDGVEPGRGCIAPGSCAQWGNRVFYLSADGFSMIENGTAITHIGANKVNRTFFNDYNAAYFHRLSASIDPNEQRVFWLYAGSASPGGQPNRVLCYDWSADRWASGDQAAEFFFVAATTGYTMDGLDAVNTNLDLIEESLDSRVWMGGAEQVGIFDGDNKLAFWSGTPRAGTVETLEFEASQGQRSMLKATRPIVDGGTTTVQTGYRNRQQDTYSWLPADTVNSNGRTTSRKTARYHRLRCNISGEFEHAEGVDVDARPAGWR